MIFKDLIASKNYEYISVRVEGISGYNPETPYESSVLMEICYSNNGTLFSRDDTINKRFTEKEVLYFEQWDNPDKNIENGLTVILPMNWDFLKVREKKDIRKRKNRKEQAKKKNGLAYIYMLFTIATIIFAIYTEEYTILCGVPLWIFITVALTIINE